MIFAPAWGSRSREYSNVSPISQCDFVRGYLAEQRRDACLLRAAGDTGRAGRWRRTCGSRDRNSTACVAQRAQTAGVRDRVRVAHSEWVRYLVFADPTVPNRASVGAVMQEASTHQCRTLQHGVGQLCARAYLCFRSPSTYVGPLLVGQPSRMPLPPHCQLRSIADERSTSSRFLALAAVALVGGSRWPLWEAES